MRGSRKAAAHEIVAYKDVSAPKSRAENTRTCYVVESEPYHGGSSLSVGTLIIALPFPTHFWPAQARARNMARASMCTGLPHSHYSWL